MRFRAIGIPMIPNPTKPILSVTATSLSWASYPRGTWYTTFGGGGVDWRAEDAR
jgi:hypothetical protein